MNSFRNGLRTWLNENVYIASLKKYKDYLEISETLIPRQNFSLP